MVELGPSMKPMVMPHYPHMLAEDVFVWSKFLEAHAKDITEVWYDVKVGTPMPLPMDATELQRVVAMGVSRKRIDVVARSGGQILVIEVKPFGNMVALGQALAYARLFASEYDVGWPVMPCVVCGMVDPDLVADFKVNGVVTFEVGS